MATQLSGLTGRRYPSTDVARINAALPYLPGLRSAVDDRKYQQDLLALEQERLRSQQSIDERTMSYAEAEAKRRAEEAKWANVIGIGNLGANAALGWKAWGDAGEGAAEGAKPGVLSKVGSAVSGVGEKLAGLPGVSTARDALSGVNWMSALPSAGLGIAAGPYIAEQGWIPFGGEAEQRIVGSGLASGALSYLTSGDPVTAGISMLMGAGGSAIGEWTGGW